jgi:glycosyltransferase involved in cell wall biosynthesis
VHGTDLLFAETHPTQLHVLHRIIAAASMIVVPTNAMADRLCHLVPYLRRDQVAHIPWGIPDQLLASPPPPRPEPDGELRLLYAGRLTAEKGVTELITTCTALGDVRLSIAAPADQRGTIQHALARRLSAPGRGGLSVRWLGWLPRPRLWAAFADHDLLVVPSTTLEAFGRVAVEAQACGLPVLHQPVPGLTETLAGSAIAVDFTRPAALAAELERLRADPAVLTALRGAGLANAARYPLSQTSARLAELTSQVA